MEIKNLTKTEKMDLLIQLLEDEELDLHIDYELYNPVTSGVMEGQIKGKDLVYDSDANELWLRLTTYL